MIASLHGKLIALNPPQIILLVAGVGYEIDLPISHLTQLPLLNQDLSLFTHLVIREDAHLLFGFLHSSERDCFRQLIKISGIGPKIALALLSTMNSQELSLAIENDDIDTITHTPGIGKKTAERMILELKGKLAAINEFMPNTELFNNATITASTNISKDITHALASLGYNNKEITQVIKQLPELSDLSQGIKEALKLLSKH